VGSLLLKSIHKRYGAQEVLKDINLEVQDGEFIIFVGPSGCGKSTLLRSIAGLEDVSSGQVLINGEDVTVTPPSKRGIAMVFQSYALYPHLTVKDNMGLGLKQAGTPKAEIETRVSKASAMLGLDPYLGRRPAEMSGGQRQRVAIGRALVREPELFLFDEPLSNLDAALRVQTRLEIAKLHRELKATMIYVTHDQIEALTLADRIAVMKGGVVQQLADPLTIYNRPKNRFVAGFLGSPSMNFFSGEITVTQSEPVFHIGETAVRLDGYDGKLAPGQKAILGVRPEHIRLDVENGFEATVDLDEPMGADSLVWLRLNGHPLSARVEAGKRYRAGEKVRIGFKPDALSLFDAQTEERL